MEHLTSFYPVVMTTDAAASADFFVTHFGFERVFAADWYVSLRRGQVEIAFLAFDHETIPAGYRVPAAGLLLNIEVDDATDAHRRLMESGLQPVQGLRDEPFGQRHFILVAPGGVLVDVIEPIEPAPEFAASFA